MPARGPVTLSAATVVIAIDRTQIRELLRSALNRVGYDVRVMTLDSVRRASGASGSAVILEIDGRDAGALAAIRELRRRTPDVLIVTLASGIGVGDVDLLRRARDLGADLTATEFIDIDALVNALCELLPRS